MGPWPWQRALVVEILVETPHAKSLVLDVPTWPGHRPGQRVDVRLTAEDGYRTQRSYSLASPPEDAGRTGRIVLTVDRLEGGEVSPYLTDELRPGDALELRGPIGGHFVWDVGLGGPLFLVAGGSGIVPLMSMIRHRAAARGTMQTRLLHSSRAFDDAIYREELGRLATHDPMLEVTYTLTRRQPAGWTGYRRRIDREMLSALAFPPVQNPHLFVCGPTPMVEVAAAALVELGHAPSRVKTERFGPSGNRTAGLRG